MAFAAPLLPLLPTILSAGSAVVTGASTLSNGYYQSQVLKNNAKIAEANAARLSEASQEEARRSDVDYRAMMGEQLAAQGASGLDILGRSQTQARRATARVGRQAARDITEEGTAAARRELQEASNFRGQAKQAVLQGYLTAGGAALGAASDIMTKGSLVGRRRNRPWDRRGARPTSWTGRG